MRRWGRGKNKEKTGKEETGKRSDVFSFFSSIFFGRRGSYIASFSTCEVKVYECLHYAGVSDSKNFVSSSASVLIQLTGILSALESILSEWICPKNFQGGPMIELIPELVRFRIGSQ